jgi:hypothetical protein
LRGFFQHPVDEAMHFRTDGLILVQHLFDGIFAYVLA